MAVRMYLHGDGTAQKLIKVVINRSVYGSGIVNIATRRHIIVISDTGYHEPELLAAGITIIHRPNNKLCCAVIDKTLCWYGNFNLIGRQKSDTSAIRLNSSDFANNLLDALLE